MKKSLLAIGLGSLLVSNLYGFEVEKNLYFGIGMTKGSGTQTREYSNDYYYNPGTYETQYDTSGTTIKLGYIFETKNRFEFSISNYKASKTAGSDFNMNTNDPKNSKLVGWDFDWLFTFRNKEALQPYLGVGFGVYKNNDIDGYNYSTGKADTATGLALNAMAGATYHINDTLEFEAGYKFKHIGWNLENPEIDESMKNLYFGANIKF